MDNDIHGHGVAHFDLWFAKGHGTEKESGRVGELFGIHRAWRLHKQSYALSLTRWQGGGGSQHTKLFLLTVL